MSPILPYGQASTLPQYASPPYIRSTLHSPLDSPFKPGSRIRTDRAQVQQLMAAAHSRGRPRPCRQSRASAHRSDGTLQYIYNTYCGLRACNQSFVPEIGRKTRCAKQEAMHGKREPAANNNLIPSTSVCSDTSSWAHGAQAHCANLNTTWCAVHWSSCVWGTSPRTASAGGQGCRAATAVWLTEA